VKATTAKSRVEVRAHCGRQPTDGRHLPAAILVLLVLNLKVLAGAPPEKWVGQGITESINDVTLSASVPGIVSAWKFKEGDFVKENQDIVELDKRVEELETVRRKLVMQNRKTDLEALQSLVKKSSISVKKEDLEKADTDYRIAEAEYEMAVEQLRKRSISSPCAGCIVEITRHPGEACEAYQPLVRVVDTRQCYFVSNLEANAAGRLKCGQGVKLEIETASAPVRLEGKIVFLSPVVDPASGLQKVRVLFDNPEGKISPGVAGKMFLE
jgi:RND family efflux transporter MFP subunit